MVTSSWNNTFISILIYSCFIYELSFVLFMFGFYQSTYSNPVIVTAYMSFLHLLLIPYLNAIRKGKVIKLKKEQLPLKLILNLNYYFIIDIPSNEKLVAVLNSIWLVSVIAVHCFLSLGSFN